MPIKEEKVKDKGKQTEIIKRAAKKDALDKKEKQLEQDEKKTETKLLELN